MNAVILSGGDGMRLRPLTCSLPKVMLKVCNIPLLEYNLSALKRHNISCIIAADRFSNIIAEHFDPEHKAAPRFSFAKSPEGTSAALQKAVTDSDIPPSEPLLVVNGGALADFDYGGIVRAHKRDGHAVTLILKKVPFPTDGIAAVEENGVLTDLIPCQPRESCASDKILTGSFVISGGAAARITEYGGDLYRDVIPAMLKSGLKIHTVTEEGFFAFLQTPDDLMKLNRDVLFGVYPHKPRTVTNDGRDAVCIGRNCDIAPDAELADGAVIGDNVFIGSGAKICGGIIGSGAYIGRRATVNYAIIGKNARIGESAAVFEGAVIGEGAVIEESAAVNPNVRIWNGRHIEPFACAANDIKYGFARPAALDEEGITGETNGIITPQLAATVGSAAASAGRRTAVGCGNGAASEALALAVISGIMAAGSDVWFIGRSTLPELAYCAKLCGAEISCYVEAGVTAKLRFLSADGLPLSGSQERLIEKGINRGEYRRSGFTRFGKTSFCGEIRSLYRGRIWDIMPKSAKGIKIIINTPCGRISELCDSIMRDISDKNGTPTVFHIGGDGVKISVYTEDTGYIFHDKLALICCKSRLERGETVSLPEDFPHAAEALSEKYGGRILRYSFCSDGSDSEARQAAESTEFIRDGVILMAELLNIMRESGKTLKELCAELPDYATVNRFIALDAAKLGHTALLRELCTEKQLRGSGVTINDRRGRVMIRPVKTGKGVMMHVESYSAEIASELCDFYQDTLNTLAKKNLLK